MTKCKPLDEILASVKLERILDDIAAISNTIPSRLTGSEAGERMAHYSRERLLEAGLQAEIAAYETELSLPRPGWIELGDARTRIDAHTFGHSGETPADGLSGALVDLGGASEREIAAMAPCAPEAIGLCDLAQGPPRQEKQRLARKFGLRALIMYAPGADDGDYLPFGSVKSSWGRPGECGEVEACIPCVGISRRDGVRLRQEMTGCDMRVVVHADPGKTWGRVPVTLGTAQAEPHDFILVGGHQDSWYGPATTDNASGSAMMFELARVLMPYRHDFARGLRFGFWAGHETGTMAGSSSWLGDNWELIRDHLAAYVEVDQPGLRGATVWGITATDEIVDYAVSAHASAATSDRCSVDRAHRIGDSSFFGAGIPTINACHKFHTAAMARSPGTPLGWWHHTIHNTTDRIDPANLEIFARITLITLFGLLHQTVLPFRYSKAASIIESAGKSFAAQCGLPVPRAVSRLVPLAASVDGLVEGLGTRGLFDESTERLNQGMRRLNQVFVPLRYAFSPPWEQDSYGLSELDEPVPMLARRMRPDPESARERSYWEVGCKRAINRFQAQVDAAVREMEGLCRDLS